MVNRCRRINDGELSDYYFKWYACESVLHKSTQATYLWDCLILLSNDNDMVVTN